MRRQDSFYAHGKLLLTGEYAVLSGAEALAMPTAKGQILHYQAGSNGLEWRSYSQNDDLWFSARFDAGGKIINSSHADTAHQLQRLLQKAVECSDRPFPGGKASTHLEFPQDWGLGSSSTLLHLVAQWLEVDPMKLFFEVFEGSGYDVACAGEAEPIIYQLSPQPQWHKVKLPDCFKEVIFVHLNTKQRSLPEVRRFKQRQQDPEKVKAVSKMSRQFLQAPNAAELCRLIDAHEALMSDWMGIAPVKQRLFKEFKGSVKSLGAWGGDFVMALGENSRDYFQNKGYKTIRSFEQMSL